MKPPVAVAMLDRQLDLHGQTIILKRGNPASPTTTVTVKARTRNYKLDELAGSLQQGDAEVILSPTGLGAFGAPKRGDWIRYDDRDRSIQNVVLFKPQDVLVRIELVARG